MNEIIATNIRAHRERLAWTQRQLADAAKITERTVQRAEDGSVMSAESLQAIAGALNVSIDDLRRDLDAEKLKAFVAKYKTVRLEVIEHASQLQRLIVQTDASFFDCTVEEDDLQDDAAEFHQELRDWIDIWKDIPELGRRDGAKSLFNHVTKFSERDLVVTAGIDRLRLRSKAGGDAFTMTTLYVLISKKDAPKLFAMVDKTVPVSFGGA
jgi:transcriptional regulator with XRE-family HTH domain